MSVYLLRPALVNAVQWMPDPLLGEFIAGEYQNKAFGKDAHGVEYTICDVGLRTNHGFLHIKPGDWIVTVRSTKWLLPDHQFHSICAGERQ